MQVKGRKEVWTGTVTKEWENIRHVKGKKLRVHECRNDPGKHDLDELHWIDEKTELLPTPGLRPDEPCSVLKCSSVTVLSGEM